MKRWTSAGAREWALALVREASANPSVVALAAIGSAVRPDVDSADVDFILIHDGEPPEFPGAPIDVDLRMYRRADVDGLIAHGHDLLGWAIKFGRIVLERDRFWSTVSKRWAERLPLPSEKTALNRAAQAKRLLTELQEIGDDDAAREQRLTMLTHVARARLIAGGVYPASRPESVWQLKEAGDERLAEELGAVMKQRAVAAAS